MEIPPILADALKTLSGTLIGLIPYVVKTYKESKRSRLDEQESEARTKLAEANARSIEIRDALATGEGVDKLLTALLKAGETIHEQQGKIFRMEQDVLGTDMLRLDLKKAMALIAYLGHRFSDAEHPEVKLLVEKLKEMVP